MMIRRGMAHQQSHGGRDVIACGRLANHRGFGGMAWLRHPAAVGEIADTQRESVSQASRPLPERWCALLSPVLAVRGCRHLPEDPAAVEKRACEAWTRTGTLSASTRAAPLRARRGGHVRRRGRRVDCCSGATSHRAGEILNGARHG